MTFVQVPVDGFSLLSGWTWSSNSDFILWQRRGPAILTTACPGSFVTQLTRADTCFVPDQGEAILALMGLMAKCQGSPDRQLMLRLLPFPTGLLWPQKIRKQGGWEAGRSWHLFLETFYVEPTLGMSAS